MISISVNVIFLLSNTTLSPANISNSTFPIHQSTIISGPAQIDLRLPINLSHKLFNTYANFYPLIPLIKVLNKILRATIII